MPVDESRSFRELCQEHGIAVTHQRQVLYEVIQTMHGHPNPEEDLINAAIRVASVIHAIGVVVDSEKASPAPAI